MVRLLLPSQQENTLNDSKKMKICFVLSALIFIFTFCWADEIYLWKYMVEPGDNLYRISRFFATRPDILIVRNGLTNPEKLNVGQFIDLFAPYIGSNMHFDKTENGYILKNDKFVLLRNLLFLFKGLNDSELKFESEKIPKSYFGDVRIETSVSDIFKLSVFLNVVNPTLEEFNLMFEIPIMSFYMSDVEVYTENPDKVEKFILSDKNKVEISNIKRLKIETADGSINFVFYGGDTSLRLDNSNLVVKITLKIAKQLGFYRTQFAVFLQK
ncbi:MAG: hypothetical protein PWQ20_1513 [Thermotogaceae bacterium]|nr:hypothetical protein [Thermotogaceae bacterium]